MANYIPTPEQKKILDSHNTLINVNYSDIGSALDCMSMQIRNQFLSGGNILVVVPDLKARQMLEQRLSDLLLKPVTLSVSLPDIPRKFEPDLLNSNTAHLNLTENYAALFNKKYDTLTTLLHKKYRPDQYPESWRDAVDTFCSLKVKDEVLLISRWLDTSDIALDEEALNALLEVVSEACAYYHPEFEVKDYSLLNRELNKNITEHNLLKETIQQISDLVNTGEGLKKKYLNYGKELENNYTRHHVSTVQRLKDQAEISKKKVSEWLSVQNELNKSLMPGFLSEKQKKHTQTGKELLKGIERMFEEVKELSHVQIDIPNKIIITLIQSCGEVAPALDMCLSSLDIRKTEYLKSVNLHNHLDPVLKNLDTALKSLTASINDAGFLHEKLEVNTLSFDKQTDIIIALVKKLELLLAEAEHSMYYLEWKHFYQKKSNQEQKILQALRHIPAEKWTDTIRGLYLHHQITCDYLHLFSITQEDTTELHDLYSQQEAQKTVECLNRLSGQNESNLKKIRKSNRELHKFLAGEPNTLINESWQGILTNHIEQIEAFFPVIITDNDQLSKINYSDNRNLIVLDHKDSNLDIMQLFKSITYYWSEKNHIDNPGFTLNIASAVHDFREIKITDRLPLFRAIAQMLLSLPTVPETYLINNACIISYASPYVTSKLTTSLYHHGIKKIIHEPTAEQAISGALLEAGHAIYCIIEDGIFYPEDTGSLLWQNEILHTLTRAGFRVIDIDTSSLFNNEQDTDKLIEAIAMEQQAYKQSSKNQTTIEFS